MAKHIKVQKARTVPQTFCLNAPAARSVCLVGDFTRWQENPISLQCEGNGSWKITVPLQPGEHRYRFLVDGEWRDDPQCTRRVANPYGTEDAVVEVTICTDRL